MTDVLPVGAPVDTTPARSLTRDVPSGHAPCGGAWRGRFVELTELDPARHASELYPSTHDTAAGREVWTYLGYGPFPDETAFRDWLADCAASEDPLFFAVHDLERDRAVGVVSYLGIEPTHRRVEIGHIWYTPEVQRGVTNTEVAYLLLARAFELGYRRLEWKCNALNERSAQAARRLGFVDEGVFRAHLISKGRNRDTAWFSMLEDEWEIARPALEAWLQWESGPRPSLASLRAVTRDQLTP